MTEFVFLSRLCIIGKEQEKGTGGMLMTEMGKLGTLREARTILGEEDVDQNIIEVVSVVINRIEHREMNRCCMESDRDDSHAEPQADGDSRSLATNYIHMDGTNMVSEEHGG